MRVTKVQLSVRYYSILLQYYQHAVVNSTFEYIIKRRLLYRYNTVKRVSEVIDSLL